jgi:hypothetical protein
VEGSVGVLVNGGGERKEGEVPDHGEVVGVAGEEHDLLVLAWGEGFSIGYLGGR